MGRAGCALDNAAAESFFLTLQHERLSRCRYATRLQARRDVAAWIDQWWPCLAWAGIGQRRWRRRRYSQAGWIAALWSWHPLISRCSQTRPDRITQKRTPKGTGEWNLVSNTMPPNQPLDDSARQHHLGMIQRVVERLASNSAQIKNWAIAILAALLLFSRTATEGEFGSALASPC